MSKKKLAAAFGQMFSGTPNTSLNDELFDGSCAAFKDLVANAKIYFEYGCGTSTLYVNNHTDCTIYAVDTSIDWVNTTLQCATNKSRMHVKHIDLGNIGEWGRPRGYSRAEFFSDYTDHLWREGISPDVVLIDGRFRVCCFLTSLIHASEGTALVFDDYTEREQYHYVENFLEPERFCGRQAIFIVPSNSKLDVEAIKCSIKKFRFVMD